MKKVILVFLSIVMLCVAPALQAQSQKDVVTVVVDYGGLQPERIIEVRWQEGYTAMRALQHAARIETYALGNYVFVTSIDGVKGERGVKGWYYTLNGNAATALAIHAQVQSGDVIRWIFKDDVCSARVDGVK